jgi:DNA-directed RNA polymerase subunit RPC12/RpoP
MNKLRVRSYLGKKHLSVPPTGSTIEEIDNLEDVCSDPDCSSDEHDTLQTVTVVGVQQLEIMYSCINCKKTIAASTKSLATCNNCQTVQKITTKHHTAKLFIENSNERISLRAHDQSLKAIALKQPPAKIYSAPPFDVTFNKYHVITHVFRK